MRITILAAALALAAPAAYAQYGYQPPYQNYQPAPVSQPRPWIPPAYPPGTLPGTMISPPPTYVLPPQPSPTQIWPRQ